jgi:glutamate-1-semialdehyde 2,1-aminomutase
MIDVELTIPTERSRALLERARTHAPGGVQGDGRWYEPHPLYIRKARGARIWDVDDNEFIDYWGAAGPVVLGHNHPRVRDAVVRTLETDGVLFTAPHPSEVELTELFAELIPCAEMTALCGGGGSDAVYNAVRLARAHTGRSKLLRFEGGYHGWHDYLGASIRPRPEEAGPAEDPKTVAASAGSLQQAIDQIVVAPFNDAEATERIIRREGDRLAAIVIEPVCHSLGCLVVDTGFLALLRALCDELGIVLIFDEIITGFRHHLGGVQSIVGITPDLAVFGKAMANGYPISALSGKREIMTLFSPEGPVFISGTFMGHLLGVTAALETIRILRDDNVHARLFRQGERMATEIGGAIDELGIDASFKQFGSAWCLYFTREVRSYRDIIHLASAPGGHPKDVAFRRTMLNNNIFVLPIKTNKGYISAAHTDEDIDRTISSITRFLREHREELR